MRASLRGLATFPVLMISGALLVGCSSSTKEKATSATSTNPTTVVTTTSSTSASSPSVTETPTTTSKAAPVATLGRCEDVLPIAEVDRAMGRPVVGATSFIVNTPDATIGQLARINCQYGLPVAKATASSTGKTTSKSTAPKSTAPKSTTATPSSTGTSSAGGSGTTSVVPQVEVSVSEYVSKKSAAARISATDSEWRAHAAVPHTVKVGTHTATVLTGYGEPLLVLATGTHTVAVNVLASAVPAKKLDAALSAIASAALRGAGG